MESTEIKSRHRLMALIFSAALLLIVCTLFALSRQMHPDERALRDRMVETAEQYLGHNEADGSHREIIDLYNAQESLPRGYAVTYEDSWCAAFVSVVAMQSDMADWISTECSCQQMIYLFEANGEWVENDWYIPQKGDFIFYAWGEFPLGECTGWADHVGIVEGVYGPIIKVIEGNKDDSVAYRYIWIGHPEIRGYGLPDYHKAAACS